MTRYIYLVFTFLFLATMSLACTRQSSGDVDEQSVARAATASSFTATLGGALTGTLKGKAMFDIQRHDDLSVLKIILYVYDDDDNYDAVNILRLSAELPKPGEHPISDDAEFNAALLIQRQGKQIMAGAESGVVIFEESNEGRLRGSFRFSGEVFSPTDPSFEGECTIEGSFDAPRGDERDLPTRF
jgi:hypothetical protein